MRFENFTFSGSEESKAFESNSAKASDEREVEEKALADKERIAKRHSFRNTLRAAALAGLGMLSGASGAVAQEGSVEKGGEGNEIEYAEDANVKRGHDTSPDSISYKKAQERVTENKDELIDKLGLIEIAFDKGGDIDTKSLYPSELLHKDDIEVDGVISLISLNTEYPGLDITVNGRPLDKEGLESGGAFYEATAPAPYMPIAETDTLEINISNPKSGVSFNISVKQETFEKIEEVTLPYTDDDDFKQHIDTTHVNLIGSNKKNLQKQIPDLKERLTESGRGILEVERAFNTNIIDTLGVIESEELNAFVIMKDGVKESTLFYFRKLLQDFPEEKIKYIARHETLHHFTNQTGYAHLRDFRELYESTDQEIFSFINETNYFDIPHPAGHSADHQNELIASFMNTLIDIEKVSENFDETTDHAWSGVWPTYSQDTQQKIINWYQRAIKILRKHAQLGVYQGIGAYNQDISWFDSRLEYLNRLEEKIN